MPTPISAVVVGAGLGGLAAGHHLRQAGIEDFVILERADKVGGTWRDNTYPGCACDTPISLYQFSFAPSFHWNHLYPRAHEVQAYAEGLCDQLGLRDKLRLGEGGAQATWDDQAGHWVVTSSTGAVYHAAVLIPALGQLNRPQLPAIAGRDSFAGPAFHSARWRSDVDLRGKRVACIGSAASAVQLIPEVAQVAGHLTVFQRTPNWLIPRLDREITAEEKVLMMTDLPMALSLGERLRQMTYDNADHFFWQAFAYTPEGRAFFTRQARDHLEKTITDADLRAKLTPDYPIGCKRILICDDFYPTLLRDNVDLVTDKITAITPAGVVTADGQERAFDVLIYATGFETTGWHWSMTVTGRDGRTLTDQWAEAPEAYLGLTVTNFPNMFLLYGPNTNLGHNTITFMIERQAEYIAKCLMAMRRDGVGAIEVTRDAQDRFNRDLQAKLAHTTWADPHCASWYKTSDGRITQNWGDHTRAYAAATAEPDFADYALRHARVAAPV